MNKTIILSLIILFAFSCKSDKNENHKQSIETTVYYLIRHAEKDRSTSDKDPELTEKGFERANNWAKILNEKEIDFVFSTDYKRTLQTASPIASAKNLKILNYDPKNLYNEEFKLKTKGKSSVIVGHSNTTPVFVNTILGKQEYQQIDDTDNGKLYIITIIDTDISVVTKDYN